MDFFITKPLFRSELVDLFEKINDFSEAVYEPEAAKEKYSLLENGFYW